VFGLAVVWGLIRVAQPRVVGTRAAEPATRRAAAPEPPPPVDRWQSAKGIAVAAAAFLLFPVAPLPEVVALTAAGRADDEPQAAFAQNARVGGLAVAVLFVRLVVVNHALDKTGVTRRRSGTWRRGCGPASAGPLFVPPSSFPTSFPTCAVMLLLPVATHELRVVAGDGEHAGGEPADLGASPTSSLWTPRRGAASA